jgi:hypothetical protein
MIQICQNVSPQEADMIRSLLESSSIQVELRDYHTLVADPRLQIAIGGVKVLVPEEHIEAASAILAEFRR